MATETVEKVLQKEMEMEAKIADAKITVIKMEEDAKKSAVGIKDKVLADAKQKAEGIIKDAQIKADEMMNSAKTEAEQKQKEIAESLSGLDAETEKIVKEILF